MKRRP